MEFSYLAAGIALIVAVWGLAYLAAPLWAWTLTGALSLGVMQAHTFFTVPLQVSLWGILAVWKSLLFCHDFSKHIFFCE